MVWMGIKAKGRGERKGVVRSERMSVCAEVFRVTEQYRSIRSIMRRLGLATGGVNVN